MDIIDEKKSPWISLLLDSNCDPAKSGGRRLVVNKYLFPPYSLWKSDKCDYVSVIYRYGPDITNKIRTRRDGPGLRRLSEAAFRSRKQTGKNYYTLYLSLFKKKKPRKVFIHNHLDTIIYLNNYNKPWFRWAKQQRNEFYYLSYGKKHNYSLKAKFLVQVILAIYLRIIRMRKPLCVNA